MWLDRFAGLADGPVADLGCGPGHVAAYLRERGVDAFGIDLSPENVAQARRLNPGVEFRIGDMLALELSDLGGALAHYAIVHFTPELAEAAFKQVFLALNVGAPFSLAFHVGDGFRHVDEFLDRPVSMDFFFFQPDDVIERLAKAGFEMVDAAVRYPYPAHEYPSHRAYLLARKP